MSQRSLALATAIAAISIAACGPSSLAGDYAYDLPQLVGHYLGDMPSAPTIELVVDLGQHFAEIAGAMLRLEGVHSPGVYGYLSHPPNTFEASAEIVASVPDQSFLTAYADEVLPLPGGAFDLAAPWRGRNPQPAPPDLSAWLDGTAEFRFQVGGPILIAITYEIDRPAATLIIHGQPELDSFMLPGDFNGDRAVDDADLAVWKTTAADGSEFLAWQRNLGAEAPPQNSAASVPEPDMGASLALIAALTAAVKKRR